MTPQNKKMSWIKLWHTISFYVGFVIGIICVVIITLIVKGKECIA